MHDRNEIISANISKLKRMEPFPWKYVDTTIITVIIIIIIILNIFLVFPRDLMVVKFMVQHCNHLN